MSINPHMFRRSLLLIFSLLVEAVLAGPPLDDDRFVRKAQFYENIATIGYERYPLFPLSRPVYSRIGNYEGHGQYLVQWDEIRERFMDTKLDSGLSVLDTRAQSNLLTDGIQLRPFGNVSMIQENVKGRGSAFFVGRGPITSFSSLVLYQVDYSGMRLDLSVPSNNISFVLSRGGLASRTYSNFLGTTSGVVDNSPVLLYGANWRGEFGPLSLGGTFLRQVQSDQKGDRQTLFRGDVPYPELQQPRSVIVRFEDDAPRDARGMAVFEAHIFVASSETDEVFTGSEAAAGEGISFVPGLRPLVEITGRRVGDHWEARGDVESVDFRFEIPPDMAAESVEIVAVVAGDYKIGIRQLHRFVDPKSGQEEDRSWPTPPRPNSQFPLNFKDIPYTREPFYTMRRAEGRPGLDELATVRFRHQIPTGQTFYSVNARINAQGFMVDGELALNPQDFIFPKKGGKRQRKMSHAGFIRLRKELWGLGGIGLELFELEPTYGGWYDSRRGGTVFFTDVAGNAAAGESSNVESSMQEFPLFEDNDDHDTWPDDVIGDFPNMPTGQFGSRDAPKGHIPLGAGAPESGVSPGLDMNRDFVSDGDVNRNAIGDWFEPFFAYNVDPPEFVYDIDFNNNGVPDIRENDNEPDYPYKRDQSGAHLFFDLGQRPTWLDQATVGWYSNEQIAGSGKSDALYARSKIHATVGGLGLTLFDDLKRVKDDIPDDVYRFLFTPDLDLYKRFNTSRHLPPADPLIMRDSMVNTLFLATDFTPIQHLELVNNFKYIVNGQKEVTTPEGDQIQSGKTLHNFTMVNKVQYSMEVTRALTVLARAKHLLVKWDEGSYNFRTVATAAFDTANVNPAASWSVITPTLKASYRLTPRTKLEFGQAGFFVPALRVRFTDREESANTYTSNLSLLQLTIEGTHQGYALTSNVGVRRELTDYDNESGRPTDKFTAFFVDVVLGLDY